MHPGRAALLMVFMLLPWTLHAQATPTGSAEYGLDRGDIPKREIGLSYDYIHANAPPGQCGCFSLEGGSFAAILNVRPRLSIVADVMMAKASHVNGTAQDITIINYLFGPRYSRRTSSRFVPYGQVLFGGAKEDVNFQFLINRNAFGLSVGGGVTTRLSRRIGFDIVQADYVYTRIPNGRNNSQNNTRVSSGLTYRF